MRFAAILPHVGLYGGVRRFLELGNRWVRRGHEFAVYHPDGAPPAWMTFRGETRSLSELGAEEHDVAFCGDPGVLGRLPECPARLRVLCVLGPRYAPKYRALHRPDFLVVGFFQDWRSNLDLPGETASGGVNLELFRPVPAPRDPARFRALVFGRADKEVKGVRYAVAAARRLRRRGVGLTLFDSSPIRLPWWWTLGLPVETVVGLPQEELPRLYASADCLVSPELSAGWSNAVAEAMACGTPVVCTPNGTADLAEDGRTALVVPPRDPAALAAAILRLREEPALGRRLAAAALERVRGFSWDAVCDRLEALFAPRLAAGLAAAREVPR
ncbi:MAG: glycosyltransferase [Planctomycetes bacterium]|nr:glycosyltransferase [Planctomycetota bacterium]